jgi:hypothetical protein
MRGSFLPLYFRLWYQQHADTLLIHALDRARQHDLPSTSTKVFFPKPLRANFGRDLTGKPRNEFWDFAVFAPLQKPRHDVFSVRNVPGS